jgi:hypothetical protein
MLGLILVTGGRFFKDKDLVFKTLDFYKPDAIIHGDCPTGADSFAKEWAFKNNITQHCFPANWELYGRSAGPIRNKLMFQTHRVDLVLAFEGNRGTADCVRQAKRVGVPVEQKKATTNIVA